jgi:hypothetical protein
MRKNKKEMADMFAPKIYEGKAYIPRKDDKNSNKGAIEVEGLIINLLSLKGSDASGVLRYIDNIDDLDSIDIDGAIVFIDNLEMQMIPRLSAMGANGIIINKLDYFAYNSIMTLSMPVGIISAFDSEDFKFDKKIEKLLQTSDTHKTQVFVDSEYSRVILINSKIDLLD